MNDNNDSGRFGATLACAFGFLMAVIIIGSLVSGFMPRGKSGKKSRAGTASGDAVKKEAVIQTAKAARAATGSSVSYRVMIDGVYAGTYKIKSVTENADSVVYSGDDVNITAKPGSVMIEHGIKAGDGTAHDLYTGDAHIVAERPVEKKDGVRKDR